MDLHQPSLNHNSSSRSAANAGFVLQPPSNNNVTVTNATTTAATVETNSTDTNSPSTSPITTIVNHQHNTNNNNSHHRHHHPHRNSQNLVTQKTNQVSTVLLYNIPIVSLYIEGQERLCLAQISNTLLKQFSYNEIHNRRVALGITCVQCTPVQLEILRRAGAMPVSSRRCGMITRREAERLCKSFLGDNTPPRLPEDFAFNVQHKCSWGCRGSFLPSRYNSSRAKCIKCHYCGMFFSPNKFIFHSHRIGPGDKYVQPDAANFNSWRRHMMLSGQPPQEVIYAWEDVKAMFNGGTRKRLMINNSSSSPLSRVNSSSPSSCSAGASSNSLSRDQSLDDVNADALLSNISKNNNSINTVTAAAAVVGVTAVAVGSTVRPLNLHFQASTAAGLATESSYSVGTDMHLIPAAAISRSFMMDYMWQHAHQAAKNTYNQQYQQHQPQQKARPGNSAFSLPWINAPISPTSEIQGPENQHANVSYSSSVNSNWPNSATTNITRNLSQIINTSAFKPVAQQHYLKKITDTPSSSTRFRRRTPALQVSSYAPDSGQHAQDKSANSFCSSDEDDNLEEQDNNTDLPSLPTNHYDKELVTDNSDDIDDDILVDIETTEDEKPNSLSTNTTLTSSCGRISFTSDNTEIRDEIESKQAASDEDVIDVVHNDNDDTVLEFAVVNDTTENDRKTAIVPGTFTSKEVDKLYNIDHSNSENVPPSALSISPKSNSSSSCSRSYDCLYVKRKSDITSNLNSNARNTSRSPDISDDLKLNLNNTNQEKSPKNSRKRPCEKLNQDNNKITWKQTNDTIEEGIRCGASDTDTKCKKKLIEPITNEVQLIEALSHKYELTYYNNNYPSCKNNYMNNNNSISNNNVNNNNNNNEFWQMARLCMQRPINFEQNQKQPHNNQQQMGCLPTFYYRQQQLHLSPAEQPNSQTALIPSTQQVYLHLQQHQQSVQKCQNSYANEVNQIPTSTSSCHMPVIYISESAGSSSSAACNNTQQTNLDSPTKTNRANGIG